jgi:hypothetical protein
MRMVFCVAKTQLPDVYLHKPVLPLCLYTNRFDNVPYVSYQRGSVLATTDGLGPPAEVICSVPYTPPAAGALVRVSVAVWVVGADTEINRLCMSHYAANNRFASFQYTPTLAPTVAPTLSLSVSGGGSGAAGAGNYFYNVSSIPIGAGICTACVSCATSQRTNCTAVTVTGVQCPPSPSPAAQPTPAPVTASARCSCPALFDAAAMTVPGLLPEFPATACGSTASVACYQSSRAGMYVPVLRLFPLSFFCALSAFPRPHPPTPFHPPHPPSTQVHSRSHTLHTLAHRARVGIGAGEVTLKCGVSGEWNYTSWDARACSREALTYLVNVSDMITNGVRVPVVALGTEWSISAVADALKDILLLGE